ncbi:hypothetical protein RFF05_14235 [Bengtsoniella intestinalis]|uniref:hypothetical protein n=1 Tax=Bengtsoniella intestinalis TaxID=3073143 RepID=UPI00391F4E9C
MINELNKNGLTIELLQKLSYKSMLGLSFARSLHSFNKDQLFEELEKVIVFYQMAEQLDEIALDYRIKSIDSCERKYHKNYPANRLEKTFNDILGFRMLVDGYDPLFELTEIDGFRLVDMKDGKANDDGYRGVHLYYQINHGYYPIEIQANSYYDRQLNNWLHKYIYKKGYSQMVGQIMRLHYESGEIRNEQAFKEVLENVLSNCKEI